MQGREVQLVSAEESEKTLHPQNRNGMPRIKDLGQGSSQTRVSNGSSCSDVLETQTWVLAPSLCPCSSPHLSEPCFSIVNSSKFLFCSK